MANYILPADGKIHTRYSELVMMTDGQVDRAIDYRYGGPRFESEDMLFGTERHKMFEEETKRTFRLPECFYELANTKDVIIDQAERELALELVPGMVIHSRPDAYCAKDKTLYDYKTALDGKRGWQENVKQYKYSKQAVFYAMMFKHHGIEITKALYLCEIWNGERDAILGYDLVEQDIIPEKIAEVTDWTIGRLALLKVALAESVEAREIYTAQAENNRR